MKILSAFLVTLLFLVFYAISYMGGFYTMFDYDIGLARGRRALRRKRKTYKGFWKKFFFLDFIHIIPRFHYICFIVNLIAFMIMLTALNILVLTEETKGTNLFYWGVIPFFVSAVPAYFSHWKRAPWNMIKPWPKKRKK